MEKKLDIRKSYCHRRSDLLEVRIEINQDPLRPTIFKGYINISGTVELPHTECPHAMKPAAAMALGNFLQDMAFAGTFCESFAKHHKGTSPFKELLSTPLGKCFGKNIDA